VINDYSRVLRIGLLREIPIVCIHHYVGRGEGRWPWEGVQGGKQGVTKPYLFGDLTSATRVSKACINGVAVDVEDVCRRISIRLQLCSFECDGSSAYHLVDPIPEMGTYPIPEKHLVVDVEGRGTGVDSAAQATRHMLGSVVTFGYVVLPRNWNAACRDGRSCKLFGVEK
jgi:hypothetical protein